MADIDMSLDDIAAKNKPERKPRAEGGGRPARGRGGGGGQRTASGKTTPYARPPPGSIDSPWKHDMYGGRASSAFNDRSGASRDAQGHTVSFHPTARLRIENVHYEIQAFQLEKIFSQAGTIVDGPKIIYDRSGRSTGLAFVTYGSVSDAKLAKEKLDGQKANGEPIKITYVPVALPRKTEGRVDSQGRALVPVDGTGKPLLGRLGGILGENAPAGPKGTGAGAARGPAPVGRKGRGAAPPARGGRGGARGAARGGASGGSRRAAPKTGDALDDELEAFMNAPAPAQTASTETTAMEE